MQWLRQNRIQIFLFLSIYLLRTAAPFIPAPPIMHPGLCRSFLIPYISDAHLLCRVNVLCAWEETRMPKMCLTGLLLLFHPTKHLLMHVCTGKAGPCMSSANIRVRLCLFITAAVHSEKTVCIMRMVCCTAAVHALHRGLTKMRLVFSSML